MSVEETGAMSEIIDQHFFIVAEKVRERRLEEETAQITPLVYNIQVEAQHIATLLNKIQTFAEESRLKNQSVHCEKLNEMGYLINSIRDYIFPLSEGDYTSAVLNAWTQIASELIFKPDIYSIANSLYNLKPKLFVENDTDTDTNTNAQTEDGLGHSDLTTKVGETYDWWYKLRAKITFLGAVMQKAEDGIAAKEINPHSLNSLKSQEEELVKYIGEVTSKGFTVTEFRFTPTDIITLTNYHKIIQTLQRLISQIGTRNTPLPTDSMINSIKFEEAKKSELKTMINDLDQSLRRLNLCNEAIIHKLLFLPEKAWSFYLTKFPGLSLRKIERAQTNTFVTVSNPLCIFVNEEFERIIHVPDYRIFAQFNGWIFHIIEGTPIVVPDISLSRIDSASIIPHLRFTEISDRRYRISPLMK